MTDIWNVLMMVPLGIGIPFVMDKLKRLKNVCVVGLIFGLVVESLQYIEMLFTKGTALRVININDIICNFFGTVLGFFLLKNFARLFVKCNEEELNKFWKYAYRVCRRVLG